MASYRPGGRAPDPSDGTADRRDDRDERPDADHRCRRAQHVSAFGMAEISRRRPERACSFRRSARSAGAPGAPAEMSGRLASTRRTTRATLGLSSFDALGGGRTLALGSSAPGAVPASAYVAAGSFTRCGEAEKLAGHAVGLWLYRHRPHRGRRNGWYGVNLIDATARLSTNRSRPRCMRRAEAIAIRDERGSPAIGRTQYIAIFCARG